MKFSTIVLYLKVNAILLMILLRKIDSYGDHEVEEIPIPFEEIVPNFPEDSEIFHCGSHVRMILEQLMEKYSSFRNNPTSFNINVSQTNIMISNCKRIVEESQSRLRIYHQRFSSLPWYNFGERFQWLVGINQCEYIGTQASWIGAILLGHREHLFSHIYSESNYQHLTMENNSNQFDYFDKFNRIGLKVENFFQTCNSSSNLERNRLIIQQDLNYLIRNVLGQLKESLIKVMDPQYILFGDDLQPLRQRIAIEEFALIKVRARLIKDLQKFLKDFKNHLRHRCIDTTLNLK